MDFELNETQQLIQSSVRDFTQRTIKPVAAELDQKG